VSQSFTAKSTASTCSSAAGSSTSLGFAICMSPDALFTTRPRSRIATRMPAARDERDIVSALGKLRAEIPADSRPCHHRDAHFALALRRDQ
jgi:hypothetical protein